MPLDEYRHKARQMQGAWEQLVKHRRQIQGRDLAPNYDAVRFWSFIASAYSLLEQCLKLLVGIRTAGYLDGSKKKRRRTAFFRSSIIRRCLRLGRSRDRTARGDGHNLVKVFGRLTKLDRELLEECYAEYASFIQFPPQFGTLREYLRVVSKKGGQIAWRYFLLDRSSKDMGGLPGPLSPDMLLEVMHRAVDILMAKGWTDHGMHGVHRRLKHQLSEALSRPLPQEGMSIEDLNAWVRCGGGLINAFSKHIRIGSLDEEHSNVLAQWLDEAVQQLRQSAKQEYDLDVLQFLHMATRCCVTTDGKRFEFRNHRPKPISESPNQWCGGWSLSWRVGESSWNGPIDDPPSNRIDKWGLPLRTGQTFRASWRRAANAQAKQELMLGTCGELKVLFHGQVLAHMRARVTSCYMSSWGNRSEPADWRDKPGHATFMRIGDCHNADGTGGEHEGDWPAPVNDYACPECAGTGFCRDCLGEATKADDCQACADALGLCSTCRGHGLDGHHAILDAAGA